LKDSLAPASFLPAHKRRTLLVSLFGPDCLGELVESVGEFIGLVLEAVAQREDSVSGQVPSVPQFSEFDDVVFEPGIFHGMAIASNS
jgi:hypothetical protein